MISGKKEFLEASKNMNIYTINSLKRAIELYKKSYKLLSKNPSKNRLHISHVNYNLGVCYYDIARKTYNFAKQDSLIDICKESISYYKKSASNVDEKYKSYLYNNLGCVYQMMYNYTGDTRYLSTFFSYFDKAMAADDKHLHTFPLANIANGYRIMGSYEKDSDKQIKYYKTSISIYNNLISLNKADSNSYSLDICCMMISILKSDFSQSHWISKHVEPNINPFSKGDTCDLDKKKALNILGFLHNIYLFLHNHQVIKANNLLYQFTSTSTLSNICNVYKNLPHKRNKRPKFKLRLYNSDYMNDTSEGHVLINEIRSHNNKELFNKVFPQNRRLYSSDVYIASLSYINPLKNDSMPLWDLYGNGHKGVALGLSIRVNNDTINMASYSHSDFTNNSNSIYLNSIPLNLYSMSYHYDNQDIDDLKVMKRSSSGIEHSNASKQLNDIRYISNLSLYLSRLTSLESDKHFINLVRYNLNKVRFLRKSRAYSYEREYRIIEENNDFSKTKYDKGNEKLYLELNNSTNINVSIRDIIFGNKCNSDYWLPIITRQFGPKIKLYKSNINFR